MTEQFSDDRTLQLEDTLAQDAVSPEEAAVLLPALDLLRRWPTPIVDEDKKAHLLRLLRAEMSSHRPSLRDALRRAREWWPGLFLRAQVRVVRRAIWVVSALLIGLGLLVTALVYDAPRAPASLPLVLFAPLAAAAGTAFVYSAEVELALELERGTPVTLPLILLARLALIFGFDVGLGLVASVGLSLLHSEISPWPLVLAWLAPMAFLSTLAFLISVFSRDAVMGAAVSASLWFLLTIGRMGSPEGLFSWLPDPGSAGTRPVQFVLALVFVLLALWQVGRAQQRLGGA